MKIPSILIYMLSALFIACGHTFDQVTEIEELPPLRLSQEKHWWESYGDPKLNQMIAELAAQNSQLKDLSWRIEEAQARMKQARAARTPQLDVAVTDSEQQQSRFAGGVPFSGTGQHFHSHEARLDLSFELDVWGRLRKEQERSNLDRDALILDRDTLFQSLVADAVNLWLDMKADAMLKGMLSESLELAQEKKELVDAQVSLEAVSKSQALKAQSAVLESQRALTNHELQLTINRDNLAFILGRDLGSSSWQPKSALPNDPWDSGLEIDQDRLSQRPDILKAQLEIQKADLGIDLAKINFLPQFNITGRAGWQAERIDVLMRPDHVLWNLAGQITAPVFQGGRNQAQLEESKMALGRWQEHYRHTLRDALKELKHVCLRYQAAHQDWISFKEDVEISQRELDEEQKKMDLGQSSRLDWVNRRLSHLQRQRNLVNAQLGMLKARSDQIRAAGWR